MGYHADVYEGIADLLVAALPADIPVVNALRIDEIEFANMARAVCILRESVDFEPHPEINPNTSVVDQAETWDWALYVKGGGGSSRPSEAGSVIDLYLEKIQTTLNAQRPTDDCGPMQLVSEDFEGRDGATVTYVQRWTHRRLQG
jgi:hypothetical protein